MINLELKVNSNLIEAINTIKLKRFMRDSPSILEFYVRKIDIDSAELGNQVTLKYKDTNAFKGYIFSIKESEDDLVKIICYDQLRYLKNSHTMLIKNKTATQLIKDLCSYFKLEVGYLENTKINIATTQKIIENKSLFEIINNAILDTMIEEKKKNSRILTYVLYDDFGKITLKNSELLTTDIVIDETNILNYSRDISIDNETYNKILIFYKDDNEQELNTFYFDNNDTQKKWGILQKVESHKNITKSQAEKLAKDLLNLYNSPKKSLKITTLNTDIKIVGGTKVAILLNLLDKQIKNYYIVNEVTHIFENDEYLMELDLLGV